jgi:drug/metabolite transporter (DMT)-like permease
MNKPYIALIVSVILWATTFGATKLSLIEIPPISLALFRFVIASLILLLFIQVKKENKNLKNAFKKDTPFFIILGLVGISLMYILENFAIKFTTTSQAAIIMNTDPILIALLAYFFIGEKLHVKKILGIVIGFVGVSLVVFNEADFIGLSSIIINLGNLYYNDKKEN